MKLNLKIGIVGAVAAVLVAIGAFGLGRTPEVRADVQAGNVYLIGDGTGGTHVINSAPNTNVALYLCSQGPVPSLTYSAINPAAQGVLATTVANPFPSGISGAWALALATGVGGQVINNANFPNTSTVSGTRPLVLIPRGTSANICVNTTALSQFQGGANGINTGTINYNSLGGAAAAGANEDGDISFDSNDVGFFSNPSCTNTDNDTRVGETGDDFCVNAVGTGTDHMTIPDAGNNLNTVIVTFTCPSTFAALGPSNDVAFPITVQQDAGSFTFTASCRGEASVVTISATPTTVEIVPARSNTSHSLIALTVTDSRGNPIMTGRDVDFATSLCSIEEDGVDQINELLEALTITGALNTSNPISYAVWEFSPEALDPPDATRASDKSDVYDGFDANVDGVPDNSRAAAILGCNPVDAPGATPGVANITACVEVVDAADICVGVSVTVVGPPASITVAASPTSLRCGEKSTITATIKDSINQNVSDHTRVEFVTNLGGTIGGTGAVAAGAGLVSPVSSSVGETFGGVATAFLITSEVTTGPYEVIATSGGTTSNDGGGLLLLVPPNITAVPSGPGAFFSTPTNIFAPLGPIVFSNPANTILGGVFSTPPVSAQVTVTCALPAAAAAAAPTITAPRTGTGITPPNTGDAGLVGSSSSNWALFAIGGIFALTLAGFATLKVARR